MYNLVMIYYVHFVQIEKITIFDSQVIYCDLFCVFRDLFSRSNSTFSDLHSHDPEKITK